MVFSLALFRLQVVRGGIPQPVGTVPLHAVVLRRMRVLRIIFVLLFYSIETLFDFFRDAM